MKHKRYTDEKNKKNIIRFQSIPSEKKIILVPQCLRNISKCKAKEFGSYYLCMKCRGCKITDIVKAAEKSGYIGVKILKGGSTVKKIISESKPEGILGVACYFEGAQGVKECEKHGICVYFYPLSKDGCESTDLELEGLLNFINGIYVEKK